MQIFIRICCVMLILASSSAVADGPASAAGVYLSSGALADTQSEARARAIMRDLRCMVCQSQSVADSDAPLAADMRRWVRWRVAAGMSDAAIRQEMVARYGDMVLMRPAFEGRTWLLWLAPFLLLIAGGGALVTYFRRGNV